MLSLNDVINASFRKSGFSGYRTDDVDQFIDEVKESYDMLIKKNIEQKEEYEKLKKENEQLLDKLKILADKIEDYRAEEEDIKNALVSAQKLGDASIRESRHKAEIIIKDASLKAERIVSSANQEITEQKNELERLQKAAADFRSRLLSIYREHLTLINALPTRRQEEEQPAPAQQAPDESPAQAPEEPIAEEPAVPVFHADVSGFDDAFEAPPTHYTAIQFGNESDISAEDHSPEGISEEQNY